MALVMAIGIVVDDAIVMGENISRRVEHGEPSLIAAYKGANEVAFPIIATTIVLIAVFMPLLFIKGIIGTLFREMAVTLSFAVFISAFVSLSISPMIGSKFLKPTTSPPAFVKKFNSWLNKFSLFYEETLNFMIYRKKSIIAFLVIVLVFIGLTFKFLKKQLIPPEDRGVFYVIIEAPQGSGFEYTKEKATTIEKVLLEDIGKGEVRRLLLRIPGFGKSAKAVNSAFIISLLEDWSDRKKTGQQLLQETYAKINKIPGVRAFPVMPQSIRAAGGADQSVQFVLMGATYEKLAEWKEIVEAEARKNPGLINIKDDFELTKPQLNLKINNEKAADLGISTEQIGVTLQTYFGSQEVTRFTFDGREYSIVLQGDLKNRNEPSTLNKIYLRSSTTGKLIPLTNIVQTSENAAAPFYNRYQRQRAVTISASLAGNYTLGEALDFLNQVVKEKLPEDARVGYKGESDEFQKTSLAIYLIFGLALITAYLAMAAQFESWIHPFTIMLTVPLAVFGGLVGLLVAGSTLNIYSQIGLIILIGLSAKNGILIVEFANQARVQGKSIKDAVLEAAKIRLRPILMTSFTTTIGVVPLIFGSGAGEASRYTIGVVIFSGMIFSTFFTLYVIPTFYYMISKNTGRIDAVEIELNKQLKSFGQS